MLFNSIVFVIFLPIVLGLYYSTRNHRAQNVILLIASCVFYGWWDYRFLGLMFASSLIDYWAGLAIFREEHPLRRKLLLTVSMVANLGILGFFKYFNFFADSTAALLTSLGMTPDPLTLNIILPVGVSFYTFQSMSYTIDVYRRELVPTTSLLDFALYVAFFPQLVAGPIERATHLLPQVTHERKLSSKMLVTGIWLIGLGYFKKLVIADRMGPIADMGFLSESQGHTTAGGWYYLYAFAFQIYGDFSGYSDIARGLSMVMGFDLMRNFRAPYLVTGPAEFWRNWHISLSTWLRDYLYIPLGGNRHGAVLTYRNLMITMLLGGLWHGAGWAYVFWGLYQGLLLCAERLWRGRFPAQAAQPFRSPLSRLAAIAIYFHVTCIGWLFFRAGTMPPTVSQEVAVRNYLASLLELRFLPLSHEGVMSLLFCGAAVFYLQGRCDELESFADWPERRQVLGAIVLLTLLCTLSVFHGSTFVYFQF